MSTVVPTPVVPAETFAQKVRAWTLNIIVACIMALLAMRHVTPPPAPAPVKPTDPPVVVVVPPTPTDPVTPTPGPGPAPTPTPAPASAAISVPAGQVLLRIRLGPKSGFAAIKFDAPGSFVPVVELVQDAPASGGSP